MMKGKKLLGNQSGEKKTPEWINELRFLIEKTKEKNEKILIPEDISVYAKMKLEKYLSIGKKTMEFDINRKENTVPVKEIFTQMDNQIKKPLKEKDKANICYSVVKTLLNELVDIAIEYTENEGLTTIGITGGVSYNIPIMDMVSKKVKKAKLDL